MAAAGLVLAGLVATIAMAQSGRGRGTSDPPGTLTSAMPIDVSHTELEQIIKVAENNPLKSADVGNMVVFIWYETRKPGQQAPPGEAELHSNITELYYILHGSATLRTGGRLLSPHKRDLATVLPGTADIPRFPIPTFVGRSDGGTSRRMSVGDMVLMPPNTIHAWESIGSEGVGYLNLRLDPMKMLRAGYTHPLLVK
jgi:mannose-6-phosphate isomerase-like protein (cupin superfamily)